MDINTVAGARTDINEMLAKIREISSKSKVFAEPNKVSEKTGFENILSATKNAIASVGKAQAETESVKTAYVTGDPHVSMSQLIVASQKSKLAFEGLVAVRNKILDAYKEIMNMQV